jgi:hypothetical protein
VSRPNSIESDVATPAMLEDTQLPFSLPSVQHKKVTAALLGAASGRKMLATTRSVIVDETHAMALTSAALIWRCRSNACQHPAATRCCGSGYPHSEPGRDRCQFPGRVPAALHLRRLWSRSTLGTIVSVTLRWRSRTRAARNNYVGRGLGAGRLARLIEMHRTTLVFDIRTVCLTQLPHRYVSDGPEPGEFCGPSEASPIRGAKKAALSRTLLFDRLERLVLRV